MTHNWPVYGHDWAVTHLQKAMANQRVRHAYLITGPESVGKRTLAHAFIMALNCAHEDWQARPCGQCRSCKRVYSGNHPDLIYAENDPQSGALKIDAIRAVTRLLALKPFDSRYRIGLFEHFERAQPRAQDALLKTLEEAPPHAILVVLAPSTDKILPTIISRCQHIPLRPVSAEAIRDALQLHGADEARATQLARLSAGRIGWAFAALQDEMVYQQREQALDILAEIVFSDRAKRFKIAEGLAKDAARDRHSLRMLLDLWMSYWRDVLLLALDSPVKPANSHRRQEMERILVVTVPFAARRAIAATGKMLALLDTNANLRLGLEVMLLDYPGLTRGR